MVKSTLEEISWCLQG